MGYIIKFSNDAVKDAKKLEASGLDKKAKELLGIIKENPYKNPPSSLYFNFLLIPLLFLKIHYCKKKPLGCMLNIMNYMGIHGQPKQSYVYL